MTFGATNAGLVIIAVTSTTFLSHLRVCAVWHWNRSIVIFFGISWLSFIACLSTLTHSIKIVEVESYCNMVITGPLILAPFLTAVLVNTFVVLAITYGICKNTISDFTFRDGIFGKTLPTFSKALLHDSQICYM